MGEPIVFPVTFWKGGKDEYAYFKLDVGPAGTIIDVNTTVCFESFGVETSRLKELCHELLRKIEEAESGNNPTA